MKEISLDSFAGGVANELFNEGFKQVVSNIADLNTEANKKRKVTIEFIFDPGKKRDQSEVAIQMKVVLQPISPQVTTVLIDKDISGNVDSAELVSGVKGQNMIDVDTGEILTDTGEKIPDSTNVVDLREQAK
ncbi:replication terminator protein [Listeria seeligeri]|uniref:replication terminator protein n=1 Tax=Listeria seeligeri TaxID=1640 RepID=UPI0018887AF7|nr:replication terminator protein [Listeria seeligeri]MBF2653919.1 replication terminator protein [Listeria seeligeri]